MIRLFILTSIFNLILGSSAPAVNKCATLFSKAQPSAEIQKHIDLTISDLAKLRISVDSSLAQGVSTIESTALSANYNSKEKEFVKYLEENSFMTSRELIARIKHKVLQTQKLQSSKIETLENENNRIKKDLVRIKHGNMLGHGMIFNPVNAGSFGVHPQGITIREPYELMSTPVTHIVWKKVIEMAEEKGIPVDTLYKDPSPFSGDTLPIESVSYIDVVRWIKLLNRLSETGDSSFRHFISGFKRGDRFRLPTVAEWEFVASERGKYNEINRDAWTAENSAKAPHPVAKKKPIYLDGSPYYDLHGNVWEFVALDYSDLPRNDMDPSAQYRDGNNRPMVGGSWFNAASEANSTNRLYRSAMFISNNVGFRLVREVQP